MKLLKFSGLNGIKCLLEANFHVSAIILITTSFMSVSNIYPLFELHCEVYGSLANNISLILVYLSFMEIAVWGYCRNQKRYQPALLFGAFLMVLIEGLDFYNSVNQMPLDPRLSELFLYVGLSHALLGALSLHKRV